MSYYLPFLELGRLAGWLRGKCGTSNNNNNNQAGRLQPPRRLLGGGRGVGGGSGGGGGGVNGATIGGRRGSNSSSSARNGEAPARRGNRNAGTRAPPSPSINRVGDESEHDEDDDESGGNNTSGDSDAFGVVDGEPRGRTGSGGGSGCGSGRAWVRGDTRADGLEGLTRQVFCGGLSACLVVRHHGQARGFV